MELNDSDADTADNSQAGVEEDFAGAAAGVFA
jgi:hypothetical protein